MRDDKGVKDYLLRATLLDTRMPCSRHLWVPPDLTLSGLHLVLQNVMQWENRHLHRFEVDGVRYGDPKFVDGAHSEEIALDELLEDQPEFIYCYDFGDSWRLKLEVLRTYPSSLGYPFLMAVRGGAPPEDCGGVPGYEKLIHLLLNPRKPDPDGLRKWVGREYDPLGPSTDSLMWDLAEVFGPSAPPSLRALGGFDPKGLNVKQAMVAALLERGQPMSLSDLTRRLDEAGVFLMEGETSLKKAWRKQLPMVLTSEGRLDLDRDCPEYLKLRRAMKPHRVEERQLRPQFLVKRFPLRSATVRGTPLDVVLVAAEVSGYMVATQAGNRSEGAELVLKAVDQAIEEHGLPAGLALDDRALVPVLSRHTGLPVECRRGLPQLEEAYHHVEHAMGGRSLSFGGLPEDLLEEFITTAVRFYLEAPWLHYDDDQMLMVEGLTPSALLVSVLGGAGQSYGLGLFEDLSDAAGIVEGRRDARPSGFLSFLEAYEAFSLREELAERGLAVAQDGVVPYCFDDRGPAGARLYRLMTDLMHLVLELVAQGPPEPGRAELDLADGREVRVFWPIDPTQLEATARRIRQKVGRNEACWCGSGKKYKKCHLGKD